ncbi:ATP-binding cassette domain-containing protein [Gracilibacillus salitolerans]|uniref:ATP-binding cassette domain-containing protein n=1 Tax=Gracilibacillus salitolerans TaxID=2663022 RepID=A0A5Q2TF90_9BACI|nr:methionine ABC transporter ATP-binding protein [Gracilibacillus salitolerans]QGH33459.1 ATP-binding cassette domain-containing protein [Gracilibacillus salitolerans]
MLVLEGIRKIYGEGGDNPVEALKDINLEVKKGEIFGVVGYSGAGKSSLIRCVNLLEKPTSGKVKVNGIDLTKLSPKELRTERKKIGMIFQQFNLLHSKTAFGNVAMPLILEGYAKDEIEKKVTKLLSFVGLTDKADHYPEQLSGGQKQRIGIARALATDPHVLLCDEATSALDPDTTNNVLELLKQVRDELGITILLITHEMNVIRDICDRVAVLDGGVMVEQDSTISLFTEPKTAIARSFVRTVLNDALPEATLRKVLERGVSNSVYRLLYKGESANDPLLSDVAKKFSIDINVIYGTITELQGQPFGNIIVEINGEPSEIAKVVDYIKQRQVTIKEVVPDGV